MSLFPQSVENPIFGFWRPQRQQRPATVLDPATRCRPRRLRTSAILHRPPELTVKLEVEKFKLYGKLKPTETHVNNSLPTADTIQTEKTLMSFDEKRHTTPDNAIYDDFYRSLTSSLSSFPSTRPETTRSSRLSSRGPLETPKTTIFSTFPLLTTKGTRLFPSSQSVVSRVVTSYGRRPSQGVLSVLRPVRDPSALSSRDYFSRDLSVEFLREPASRADSRSEANSTAGYLDVEETHSLYSARS